VLTEKVGECVPHRGWCEFGIGGVCLFSRKCAVKCAGCSSMGHGHILTERCRKSRRHLKLRWELRGDLPRTHSPRLNILRITNEISRLFGALEIEEGGGESEGRGQWEVVVSGR
jgi:hypothetical protein